jgi:hypothetical protein
MMRRSKLQIVTSLVAAVSLCWTTSAVAGDTYDDAVRAANEFLDHREEFMRLDRDQLKELVTAICDAEEDDRQAVAEKTSDLVRARIRNAWDYMEKRHNDAIRLLDIVIGDEQYKDRRSSAEDLKRQVESRWETISKMYDKTRGANHPVVSYMLAKGKDAHRERQQRCKVYEFETGNGPADCINPCEIVEFKPDNSAARSKGHDQLERYERGLRDNPNRRDELNAKDADFKRCTTFEKKMECYRLCPEIDDDGNFREASVYWNNCY